MRLPALLALLSLPALGLDAEELARKHLDALGGEAALKGLSTLRLTGTSTFGQGDGAFVLKWTLLLAGGVKAREEVTLQGLTAIEAFDGAEGWTVSPFQGRRDPDRSSADDAKNARRTAEYISPLVGWKAKKYTLQYLGTEEVDGTLAHKLKVNRGGNDFEILFLDPDAFLIIRSERHVFVRGAEQVTQSDVGNYEKVAGVWVPFSVDFGPVNRPRNASVVVEKAEANLPIDDALFAFPRPGVTPPSPGPAAVTVLPGSSPAPQLPAGSGAAFDSAVVSGLGARNIGSAAMSGRVSAVAAYNEKGRTVIFVGAASGGVWKSIDSGTTFKPVFDRMPVQSIGAIAVDPTNPKIVWVGTGEPWTRNSVSFGDGIYKSVDGGETWVNVGLPNSERITKIIVHPKDGNTVYACVPGKLWSDSAERGLYRTRDGGKSWALVLKGPNLSTGCSGVSLDPENPSILFAGLWDFRRTGWSFRSGGDGPTAFSGSGLFRSADGGATWTEVTPATASGLPAKPYGRIEVVHAPSSAKTLYAFIEGVSSALYASEDGGKTWDRRDSSQFMTWRPFYFARLVVDPRNPLKLFKGGGGLIVSDDGGKSFSGSGGGGHGDWHDLWIDPDNTQHIVAGDDGGLWISHDGGSRWWKVDSLPLSQFYHVSVDDADPYRVYGGLQDNSSWIGVSEWPSGIRNEQWENIFGGDGFWVLVDPTDPDGIYAEAQGGYIGRFDRKTRLARDIQPKARYREKLRFNWNTPMYLSPTAKGTLYLGAQFLFRSRDRGNSWERISPDLTTNDPKKQRQEESGGITVDNSSAEMHTTIYAISESAKDPRVLWVGTDDGNLQLTRDGARTWTNVTANLGAPEASWVSWVEASRFAAGTAYVALDRHTLGDFEPYVYRTTDFGKSWTRVAGPAQGLRGWVHTVREDPVQPGLLFAGTEVGLWISIDGGERWAEFKGGGFPAVAVREVQVHPRTGDLVIATHGRGIWIIDDLSPLRGLSARTLETAVAFLPSRPSQQRLSGIAGWVDGDAKFVGDNPRSGAVGAYFLRRRHLFGPLTLEVLGPDGKVLDTVTASKARGINRVGWTARVPPPRVPRAAQIAFSASRGPRVLPGTYTLRMKVGAETLTTPLPVVLDRRAPWSLADRKAQLGAVMRVHALFGEMSDTVALIDTAAGAALASRQKLGKDEALGSKLEAFAARLGELKRDIVATKEGGAITGEERIREHADFLYGAINDWEGRPAGYHLERIDVLTRELAEVKKAVQAHLDAEVPGLDRELEQRKLSPIPTKLGSLDVERLPGSGRSLEALGRMWRHRGAVLPAERVERD